MRASAMAHRRRTGGGRLKALAGAVLLLLLPAACAEGASPPAGAPAPTGELQRAVVVDAPSGDATAGPATPSAGGEAPVLATPPLSATADPLADAALFATATADAMGALGAAAPSAESPAPPPVAAPAGLVLSLDPLPCGALTLDSQEPPRDCAVELLQSGRLAGRELLAFLGFDLGALPLGIELLYAGLELVTADDRFAAQDGAWRVEAIALPSPSFSQALAARPLSPHLVWRVEAAELAPGRRLTLELGEEARAFLAERLAGGEARLGFRIQGPGRGEGLVSWQARGQSGPRLRLAYLEPAAAGDTPENLVDWQSLASPALPETTPPRPPLPAATQP